MPLHCPNCGSEYHDGITECTDCKVPLMELAPGEVPRKARLPLFPTIPKRLDDRPWLVKVVPWLALLVGAAWGLTFLFALGGGLPQEKIANPLTVALIGAGEPLVAFLIAYSFWRRLPWSRPLLITSLGLEAVRQLVWQPEELKDTVVIFVDTGTPSLALWLGLLASYFYLKPNVRSYFRRLESRDDETEPQSVATASPLPVNLTLHYTEPLVRRSVRRFCARSIGWIYPVALLLLVASVALRFARGDLSWVLGMLGTILGFSVLNPFVRYRNQLAAALYKFRALEGNPVVFAGTETSFSIQSPAGLTELPWRSIVEVWREEDFWLLLFSKGNFMTFPLDGVPAEARTFLLEQVKARGGKVD